MQGPIQGNVVFKPEKISIESAFSVAWAHTKRQFVPLLLVGAVSWVIPAAFAFISFLMTLFIPKDQAIIKTLFGLVAGILSLVVNAILELGMINVYLRVLDGEEAKVADLFSASKQMFTYVMGNFCFNIMLFWGYLCFIVPGVLVSIAVQFYSYFIVDKEIGPIESIRASWIASRGARLNILLMVLLFHLLRGFGAMMFVIGAIPVNMVISLATADLYRQLVKNTAPDDFAGIEGLRFALPTQEEFEERHRLVKPWPSTQSPTQPSAAAPSVHGIQNGQSDQVEQREQSMPSEQAPDSDHEHELDKDSATGPDFGVNQQHGERQ
ncbi:MAG: hypothetical protein Q8T09_19530 [Candidatus Melainabacteria bacterium]|nr:hypothetical protein [Candidatus Melainabacteria bacterium]